MKRRKKENQGPSQKWMTTFSDLVTLILVFFILLFSMSQIDIVKFSAIAQSLQNRSAFNFDGYPSVIRNSNPSETPRLPQKEEIEQEDQNKGGSTGQVETDSLQQLMADINTYLIENGLTDVISANREERGVVLVLQEKVLFDSGTADLLPSAYPFLDKVGTLLQSVPNPIKVEGHTDNRPISTYRFPSNWELSGARAGSVIRYIVTNHHLDNTRFTGVAYGDTRPIVENNSPENWQKNRRVEIVISDPEYAEIQSNPESTEPTLP